MIRDAAWRLLASVGARTTRWAEALQPPDHPDRRFRRWRADDGDATLRLDYDLGAEALVFDVGGYRGQWASDIVARFACRVWVFEPVRLHAERIERRFARNPLVRVFAVALSDRDGEAEIALAGDGSSLHRFGRARERILMRRADALLAEHGIERIDLMKVNVEGAEYDLLDHLADSGRLAAITHLQVQFHEFVPGASERYAAIATRLRHTHDLAWRVPFVWEGWSRRSEGSHPR